MMGGQAGQGEVAAVACNAAYRFSKPVAESITLIAGWGVKGDAHSGALVKHRSRVARDPTVPNLRQVHLMHAELLEALALRPGDIGENITTRGLDILGLPEGAELHIGAAVIRVTGLRNPCKQLNDFRPGLMEALLDKAPDGTLIRKAGIMGIVLHGGTIRAGDAIRVQAPALPHRALVAV